jgi:hypothetical protein
MKSLFCPESDVFLFSKGPVLPCFTFIKRPSSCLMTVMSHVSVSNRRKDMSGKAAKIMLTERQYSVLQQIIHSTTAAQRLAKRARLIVLAFGGMFNGAISGAIGLRRK